MLHIEIRWPDKLFADLWPISLKNSSHLHNTTTRYDSSTTEGGLEGFSPMEIFSTNTEPRKDGRMHPLDCSML